MEQQTGSEFRSNAFLCTGFIPKFIPVLEFEVNHIVLRRQGLTQALITCLQEFDYALVGVRTTPRGPDACVAPHTFGDIHVHDETKVSCLG